MVQLDNEFPYILTEWYLSQYAQLLIAGWFKSLWSHVLCFDVVWDLLARNTSVEIRNSILHLNNHKKWNLAHSTRPMPKLNNIAVLFLFELYFLFTVEGELLSYGKAYLPYRFPPPSRRSERILHCMSVCSFLSLPFTPATALLLSLPFLHC